MVLILAGVLLLVLAAAAIWWFGVHRRNPAPVATVVETPVLAESAETAAAAPTPAVVVPAAGWLGLYFSTLPGDHDYFLTLRIAEAGGFSLKSAPKLDTSSVNLAEVSGTAKDGSYATVSASTALGVACDLHLQASDDTIQLIQSPACSASIQPPGFSGRYVRASADAQRLHDSAVEAISAFRNATDAQLQGMASADMSVLEPLRGQLTAEAVGQCASDSVEEFWECVPGRFPAAMDRWQQERERLVQAAANAGVEAENLKNEARLDAAEDCFSARNFDCAMQIATEVIKKSPDNQRASQLARRAREAQEQALNSDWNVN